MVQYPRRLEQVLSPNAEDKPVPAPERVMLRRRLAVLLWRGLAVLAMGLGLLGVALPVVPTVPFILVAAWAASKGWPAFEIWLLNHRVFGPPILQWRLRGTVARRRVPHALKHSSTTTGSKTAPTDIHDEGVKWA